MKRCISFWQDKENFLLKEENKYYGYCINNESLKKKKKKG